MSFQPSDPTTLAGWLPDAATIGDILRGGAGGGGEDPPPDPGSLRAFPGAAGYGAEAMLDADWDDVRIYFVDNLNRTGAGSLHQAIEDAQAAPDAAAKFIIFRTGGWSEYCSFQSATLDHQIIDGQNIYMAGQTAPGDGIGLGGDLAHTESVRLTLGWSDDAGGGPIPKGIILRYLTIRGTLGEKQQRHSSCLLVHAFDKCIVDHVSTSWAEGRTVGGDGGPPASDEARKLTYSHCIFFESLAFHPSGHTLSGDRTLIEDTGVSNSTHISMFMNHFANNRQRSPNFRECQLVEVINNVVHNCRRPTWFGGVNIVDFIANWHSVGDFNQDHSAFIQILNNQFDTIAALSHGPSMYVEQNVSTFWDLTDPAVDNWLNANLGNQADIHADILAGLVGIYSGTDPSPIKGDATEVADWRRTKRFYEEDAFVGTLWEGKPLPTILGPPAFPHIILTPSAARTAILGTGLDGAGNIHGINAAGEWFTRIDAVDQRAKDEALGNQTELAMGSNGRESVSSGDYPTLAAGTAPTDTDDDGLPDAYCTKWGLSTSGNFATVLISEDFPSSPIGARPHIWAWLNGVSPVDGSTQMES